MHTYVMHTYALSHLNDAVLLRDLNVLVSRERGAMAAVIAHLAEVDARRLYLPAGYPSMFEYCLRNLGWSEQAALRRIRAARTARRFPVIFPTLAAGRLHLTAVVLLAPHLTADNAEELLAAAAHRTKGEIEELLARRFPRPDVLSRLEPIAPASLETVRVPTTPPFPASLSPWTERSATTQLSLETVSTLGDTDSLASAGPAPSANSPRLVPLAPERFLLQFTIPKDIYEKLRHVQALLSHQVPSGDVVQVFDRALDALTEQLEKRKFAATAKPRSRSPLHRPSANPRYIPAPVKRAVWARDGGQCTFVSAAGERCPARRMLEFDHVDPVARGGRATVDGMRLLCRGHNQYEADCRFGAGFMNEKRAKSSHATGEPARDVESLREDSRGRGPSRTTGDTPAGDAMKARSSHRSNQALTAGRGSERTGVQIPAAQALTAAVRSRGPTATPAPTPVTTTAPSRPEAILQEQARDVMAGLRALGFRAGEARRATDYCGALVDATLEERMRAALRFLCPAPG